LNKQVILKDNLLVAKGGERACYINPDNSHQIIKIIFVQGEIHNNQNELENTYMKYLMHKKVDMTHIAKCYGYVDTNLGKGLVYERIMDFDGTATKSFRFYIANKLLSKQTQEQLIKELKTYLETNLILFVDTSLTNIFCQQYEKDKFKLIIIDGLGAKRTGFKFWLYRNFELYTKYKIKRQWDKFIKMYQADVKRADEGKRPFTRL
jgi:hypothetical protein